MEYVSEQELLYQKANEGCPESIMMIGFNYYHGIGVTKDIHRSLGYFNQFYSCHRADTKSTLPNDFKYYAFMATFALDCLNYFYLKESKELFERVLIEGSQVLSSNEINKILEEYRVLKILHSIEFVESKFVQTDFLDLQQKTGQKIKD